MRQVAILGTLHCGAELGLQQLINSTQFVRDGAHGVLLAQVVTHKEESVVQLNQHIEQIGIRRDGLHETQYLRFDQLHHRGMVLVRRINSPQQKSNFVEVMILN